MWTSGLGQDAKVAVALVTQARAYTYSSLTLNYFNNKLTSPRSFGSVMIMNNNTTTNPPQQSSLDSIFAQKRLLRSKVRRTLKSMDPSLRSYEGQLIIDLIIILYLYFNFVCWAYLDVRN